jgi:hypothetical protein
VAGVVAAAWGGVYQWRRGPGRPRDGGSGRQRPGTTGAPGRPRDGARCGSGWAVADGRASGSVGSARECPSLLDTIEAARGDPSSRARGHAGVLRAQLGGLGHLASGPAVGHPLLVGRPRTGAGRQDACAR